MGEVRSTPKVVSHSLRQPGDTVGPYHLVRLAEARGDEERWLARTVDAAGVIRPIGLFFAPASVPAAKRRAWLEPVAQIGAALDHANVERFVAVELGDEDPHLAYSWAEGVTLDTLAPEIEALATSDAAAWRSLIAYVVRQIAEGLEHAHESTHVPGHPNGVFHRQLAPGRVFVSTKGEVIVRGFGVSNRPHDDTTGVDAHGLLRYLPAEQLGGRRGTAGMDLFALGGILHELMDGQQFRCDCRDAATLYHAVAAGEVPPLRRTGVGALVSLDSVRASLLLRADAGRPTRAREVIDRLPVKPGVAARCEALVRAALAARAGGAVPTDGPAWLGAAAGPTSNVPAEETIELDTHVLAAMRRANGAAQVGGSDVAGQRRELVAARVPDQRVALDISPPSARDGEAARVGFRPSTELSAAHSLVRAEDDGPEPGPAGFGIWIAVAGLVAVGLGVGIGLLITG